MNLRELLSFILDAKGSAAYFEADSDHVYSTVYYSGTDGKLKMSKKVNVAIHCNSQGTQ